MTDTPTITEALVETTVRQKSPVVADYGDSFLVAHVSKDGTVVGIDHPCDALWSDVLRAHLALRDRINERVDAQDGCPFKPKDTPTITEALEPCPFCGGENVDTFGPYGWYQQWGISHSCPTFYSGSSELCKGFASEASAIAAWNTRPLSARQREAAAERARWWRR